VTVPPSPRLVSTLGLGRPEGDLSSPFVSALGRGRSDGAGDSGFGCCGVPVVSVMIDRTRYRFFRG
jgi:hypothetical protein